MLACDTAGFEVAEHFPCVKKEIEMPTKPRKIADEIGFPDLRKTKKIIDYNLSRNARRCRHPKKALSNLRKKL
jgi:hypothetical protein